MQQGFQRGEEGVHGGQWIPAMSEMKGSNCVSGGHPRPF